jgi:site-specific DNA recombinase
MTHIIEQIKIKFVAIYVRVSTSNQEKQNTIQNQIMVLEEYAKKEGYIIVERYVDDGWSGDTLIRPDLDRLRLDAKSKEKKWDAVLIYDPDRLARRYSYQELVIDELREKAAPVIFLTIPAPTNEEDKLLYGVRGLFTQYERFKISERFRLGKLRTVKEGHVIANAPYGFKYIHKNKENGILHGFYEIVESEARIVRMIFEWIAYESETVRGVIRRLKELKIKPRRSKKGVWSTSTLSTLLNNKAYIGEAQWGKSYGVVPEKPYKDERYRKNKKSSRKFRPEAEWIKIPVPKIIEPDLFWKVRAKLEANFQLADRRKKNDYLLAGKIWCVCGERRCGSSPLGGKNIYYRCNDRIKKFPMPKTCFEKGVNARIADKFVWQKISNLMASPDLMLKQVNRWMDKSHGREKITFSDIDVMKKEISDLRNKEDRYSKAYADGVFALEKLKEYTAPIREKVSSLEFQILKAKEDIEETKVSAPSSREIEDFAELAIKKLRSLKFEQKRGIVISVIDKVVANQDKLLVYGYVPINLNVTQCSNDRNCWSAKRGEVHTF